MLGIIVLLGFLGTCAFTLYQLAHIIKRFFVNETNSSTLERVVQRKYENAMERLVNIYREDNEMLKEQVKDLTEENKSLVHVMDSELFENSEDEDEDEDDREVVLTMDKPIRSSVGKPVEIGRQDHYTPIPQSKLFKKLEAARKVVQTETAFIPKEVRAKLIELLTPENDVEAA